MKFSKILFIVGAFALIGLTLSTQRSERSEAQYQSMTQSLRVEVGYKELLTPPSGEFSQKVLERDYKGIVTYRNKKTSNFVLQATMLKEGAFRSGIPFFTSNPENFSTPGFSQIFIAIPGQDKVQYIPFVQLTQSCMFDIAVLPLKMTCPVKTNVGAGILGFEFDEDVMDTEALTIINQLNKLKNFRETEINRTIVAVLDAIIRLKGKQKELKDASAKVSDAYKKQSEKQKIITLLIRRQGDIDDQIGAEADKYKQLTSNVEKITKKISYLQQKIRIDQIQRIALRTSITSLNNDMTVPDRIKKGEADMQIYIELMNYWIQGAVFHRIIDDDEAVPLGKMVTSGQIDGFNTKIDDYFFPQ